MLRFASLAVIASTGAAYAGDNDLVMARLATPVMEDGEVVRFAPENGDLRSLASQLGVVLAPHLLTPADTLGFGGFQVTFDSSVTTIDADAAYWRARRVPGADTLTTIGMFARKGIWLPVPSFEVGAGATHVLDSNLWTAQLYGKLALHEGYHQLPLPSLALRGGVSRMMNQRELDLTVVSLDAVASKHLGIGGTWRLDPYAGWNVLLIVPRSEVIDPTPQVDGLQPGNEGDNQLSFVFEDQDNIVRQRFVVGAKAQYHVVQLTLEASFALAGTSVDRGTDAEDRATAQRTLSLSAGVDF